MLTLELDMYQACALGALVWEDCLYKSCPS